MTESPAYLNALNERQRAAVLHSGAPLLILAGAGSGKTRVITTKIAFALDVLKVAPAAILAVTFTNKAATEMRERLDGLTPLAPQVLIKTFHAFGAWVLRRYGQAIGVAPRFLIYDDADAFALLKAELKKTHDPDEIRRYLSLIAQAKDLGLTPAADEKSLKLLSYDPKFPLVFARYEERLRSSGNLDFGDLILKSLLLLKHCPEAKTNLQRRFTHILVDEYQDSNIAQYQLLKELFSPGSSLVVVGDDDQSIYGFRGAEVENILTFPDSFPGTVIIRLEENYRSTKTILAAASAVVSHNQKRLGKVLTTNNEEGAPIRLALLNDHAEEALYAARVIERNPDMETAILYRLNYQSRVFEELFGRLGIPHILIGSVRFYEREEVKDVLAYLSLLVNPLDEVAARRVIHKPPRGIGEKTEEKLFTALPVYDGNFLMALGETASLFSGRVQKKLNDFSLFFKSLTRLLSLSPLSTIIREVIIQSGLYDHYQEKDARGGTAKANNLEELVNAAAAYGAGEQALGEFLENALLKNPEFETEAGARVTLITLHNTKGLEFDRVIITGLEEGVFPGGRGKNGEEDLEEERRLFYVGLTRARRELFLTHCRRRLLFGTTKPYSRSRFLDEIPESCLVRDNAGGSSSNDTQTSGTAFPPGCRVYSDDYGRGLVVRSQVKEGALVLEVRFDTGRAIRLLPRYHDLTRIEEE